MSTNNKESTFEKVTEFFTQSPEDRAYEKAGGDGRVPQADRQGNPRQEARHFARVNGEEDPYPEDGDLPADSPKAEEA